jgi:hypothetical protein
MPEVQRNRIQRVEAVAMTVTDSVPETNFGNMPPIKMTYLIQFWSPWSAQWIPWAMSPVQLAEAQAMLDERSADDPSLTRRIVRA